MPRVQIVMRANTRARKPNGRRFGRRPRRSKRIALSATSPLSTGIAAVVGGRL